MNFAYQVRSIVFLAFAFIVTSIGVWVYSLNTPVVTASTGVIYELNPGTTKRAFLRQLQEERVLHHPLLYAWYIMPQRKQLKAGEYVFEKGSTLRDIWWQVTEGTGVYYRGFTIVPGWTFAQLRENLKLAPKLSHDSESLTDAEVMQKLGLQELQKEARFLPETYFYQKGESDLMILKRALTSMQRHVQTAWETRDKTLPYQNLNEALIAASLIEKEAYFDKERPIIAGVLINRLNKNMRLQFDPTIIYGLGNRYTGVITRHNLNEDTPYNTYIHKGLPPTPIAIPSVESLQAALHPARHEYLYFVAFANGQHQFSRTLAEHNLAVEKAILERNASLNESYLTKYLGHRFSLMRRPYLPYHHHG